MLRTRAGAPPCSGPDIAPIAPEIAAATEGPQHGEKFAWRNGRLNFGFPDERAFGVREGRSHQGFVGEGQDGERGNGVRSTPARGHSPRTTLYRPHTHTAIGMTRAIAAAKRRAGELAG